MGGPAGHRDRLPTLRSDCMAARRGARTQCHTGRRCCDGGYVSVAGGSLAGLPSPGGAAVDVGLPFDLHIDSGKETVTNMLVSQKRWGGRTVLYCNIIRPEMVWRVC
ncbi:hypothetical protein MINTM019_49190 [Mycobacterium paraintracellulare]|uniref:Uncharacterized protein n=1 Tax=Mycobacterium paraintracellulare TaxID=1138383 RepID=A0ABM7K5G3_9MYCO|nr:hypothetical protein MPRI_14340 [Mycobacterium paraintracellulare]BCO54317.1 hypothetical protein MINTM003_47580 [Mycobacterium paraintracellulare]BCO86274.1 hypothetical protein MINTM011_46090 [Mycobacterium paraintracellulare]BCO91588.1 hypothetical protein MINTM015_48450 [Mycobacterium paraintracellulare]BCP07463.1 hypothetical protein MINTM019_49190 [Mycobacterium paraintracellulare]